MRRRRYALLTAEEAEGEWVFSVKDDGIGNRVKRAEKIFEMFKRLDGAKNSGAGIGLAISKKVVERLGGRIWVESQQEHGSNFKFTVPPRESSA